MLQRNQRLAFCNKNIDRDWSSVVFTDESSFYLHSPGTSRWVPKGESNIVVKEKYSKKSACMGSILKQESNLFRIFWRKHG